jgi:hypothetical protein
MEVDITEFRVSPMYLSRVFCNILEGRGLASLEKRPSYLPQSVTNKARKVPTTSRLVAVEAT